MNFKGKSAYTDQFHQFKSKDYNDKYHKEEQKKAPFAIYAPFIDQTTNQTQQNRMAHHAARSFSQQPDYLTYDQHHISHNEQNIKVLTTSLSLRTE